MNTEIWRRIPGYDYYLASSLGRIKSMPRTLSGLNTNGGKKRSHYVNGKLLRNYLGKNGYYTVNIHGRTTSVHVLICLAFHEKVEGMNIVEHLNDIKTDNSPKNLRWSNKSQNYATAKKNGRLPSYAGENAGMSRLKTYEVTEIRRLYALGSKPKQLSETFKVQPCTISNIVARRLWKHI